MSGGRGSQSLPATVAGTVEGDGEPSGWSGEDGEQRGKEQTINYKTQLLHSQPVSKTKVLFILSPGKKNLSS